jgi:hypothetical protein
VYVSGLWFKYHLRGVIGFKAYNEQALCFKNYICDGLEVNNKCMYRGYGLNIT